MEACCECVITSAPEIRVLRTILLQTVIINILKGLQSKQGKTSLNGKTFSQDATFISQEQEGGECLFLRGTVDKGRKN